ncbi:imidazole glycerol phosphate synthase subunit HisH [Viridibacillus sp. YIM B01967]|uniref:Imidazole glycerol phosphate synthase subunit HisH n=1 Tax=Viridibacillus soli TaxID=2798301 RepID=A0ABS1H9A4_9BACL|nr:imidazole glycerol phosphate synthase subunit HisH [Viridibacillus soli]MBK3495998.1 imidazole glycerol phosphate synthase subunit HisH [Viridibacillus soli]
MKIGIIDYGMGNLFSVEQAIKRLGCNVLVSDDKEVLLAADALILPGVGAFQDAMKRLQEMNLVSLIDEVVKSNKPLLGICLGMQLLFEESEENGYGRGLGIFKGRIECFAGLDEDGKAYRVPHMGWNELQFVQRPDWLGEIEFPDEHYVYFVHSYFAANVDQADLVAFANYGNVDVPGIVQRGSITGMQFHPEKSGEFGVFLLKKWLDGVEKGVVAK